MNKVLIVVSAALVLILAGAGFLGFKGYQSLTEMRGELRDVRTQMLETRELAEQGSSYARAASSRADEARRGAELAAGQRQQAEAARQIADQQRSEAVTAAQQAEKRVEEMKRERQKELDNMQQALNRIVETKRTSNGMVMVLPDSTFRFDFDSADLNAKNRELLSRISGVLLVSKGYGLAIHGYTDDVGSPEYNKQLSLRRAKAVADYLAQSGVDPKIMSVEGFGKSDPRVKGASAENRAQNRRVEIGVVDSSIQYLGEAPSH